MTTVRLRHLAQVNPLTLAFDRLADEDELTFLPMEAVWPGNRLDITRRRPKASVATGYTRFQDGDVLVPKITPTFEAGRAVLIGRLLGGVGAGTTELHVVRPGPHIDPRFLLYVVNTHRFLKLGEAEMYGVAGQQRVPDSFLRDLPVELPSLKQQRRIADFLDAETARIDQLALKRRQMRSLLALKRERVIESTLGLERAQTTDTLVPLKYLVADVTVGIVITPAKWYVEAGGTPALRGLNVKPGFISTSDLVQISAEGHAENRKSRINAGDVVVVRTGQAGAAAVVPAELDGANCIDLIVVRPGKKLASRYLQYVLNSGYASARVTEHSVGSIQAHFNVSAMKQIPIPSIPRAEQDKIVHLLDVRVGALDLLHRKLDRQEQLLAERRQALITAAVTGQFDISTASGRNVTDGVTA
ncbi:restriction endonuclease subunit S [Streptomyces sp. RFCAC02]|uniref:restriction endonuclease subunit S n=1 Tax=Streptomyces sp. RFCAC02 TaxID=2499143 RepID=UPI001022288B|nr:restriction endonuclease subunit S [Streptomyces sp. RFCAC02]